MEAIEKIAKILRADKRVIHHLEDRFSRLTGRQRIFEQIVQENEKKIKESLLTLDIPAQANAKEIYSALISKIEADGNLIFEVLKQPRLSDSEDCQRVLEFAQKIIGLTEGFFLKKEKAEELLVKNPPQKILSYLKYKSVEEMLVKEDLWEIYSALRFREDKNWLNQVFFKEYENLKPEDFEKREIRVLALSSKWVSSAESFISKKWHNISHLKEMGVVFVIPVSLGFSGELLRMLSLIFHYFHEISFYSQIIFNLSKKSSNFSQDLISLLRGDVIEKLPTADKKIPWLVIQRYLAKDDENDQRLFFPHISPEAIHWSKVGEDLIKSGAHFNHFGKEMGFWFNLDWVGDYFKDEIGEEVLVSFNLVDTVMSLVKEKEMIKYLYHHQEALWNKIFSEYFNQKKLEKFAQENLLKGYFEI